MVGPENRPKVNPIIYDTAPLILSGRTTIGAK